MATPPEPPDPGGGGNVLTQRVGPLATWVWLLGLTVLILIYAFVKKGKAPAAATAGQATAGQSTAAQNVPDIIIQNNEPGQQTPPPAPPPGATPPSAPLPVTTPPPGLTLPSPPRGLPTPVSAPPPKSTKPPVKAPAPKYTTVTVARWTAKNAPWNSTLSGIAAHYNVKGGYEALAKLNGIKNPNLITPGQKIKVPE